MLASDITEVNCMFMIDTTSISKKFFKLTTRSISSRTNVTVEIEETN